MLALPLLFNRRSMDKELEVKLICFLVLLDDASLSHALSYILLSSVT